VYIYFLYDVLLFLMFKLLSQAGDSTPEELANATQVHGDYMPITRGEKRSVEVVKVTDEMKAFNAYGKLCVERMNQRQLGARLKKAAEAEKEEKK
jgi:large subunit ribosomal protein L13e